MLSSCVKTEHFPVHTVDSFLKIQRVSYVLECNENSQACIPDIQRSSGSGALVSKGRLGGLVLTAAHVCNSIEEASNPSIKHFELSVVDLSMKSYSATIVNLDYELDTCALAVQGIDLPTIPIYEGNLKLGTKGYNIAAPVGTMKKNMVPLLDGYFIGNDSPHRAMFTIPAAGGSSGSPIVNSKGELIGMIHSVNVRFPMLTISPELENLSKFITESKKAYNFIVTQAIQKESR